jgi:hypothetical protein
MSYDSTILADSPVAYWKTHELLTSEPMADASGNSRDGTIFAAAPGPPTLGIEGPIETDSGSLGGHGAYGNYVSASGSATDLRTAFSWEVWGRLDDLSQDHGLLTRNGQYGLNGSNLIGFNSGAIQARISFGTAGADTFNLSYANIVAGSWYHALVVRSGNSALLYVNGVLRDSSILLPVGDLVYANYNTGDWIVGALNSTLTGGYAFYSEGVSHPALYATALSAVRALAHYEAARARLPMYVTFSGRSSFIIDSTPPPVYSPVPYLHDFSSPIIERLSRPTEIIEAVDGTEERTGQSTKTRRILTHGIAIMDAQARRQLAGILAYNQGLPIPWPISQDRQQLPAAITAGATTIPGLVTDYRDFDPDGRALIFDSEFNFEEIEIASLAPLTTIDPIVNNWPITAEIVPLKLAYIDQLLPIAAHTSRLQDASVRVSILVEEIADSPNRITTYTPAYTYRSVEVFDPREWGLSDYNDPLDHDTRQKSELLDARTGLFRLDASDVDTSRSGLAYKLELDGRDIISKFLGWYELHAGRLDKLWLATFQEDFELVSISGSTITVTRTSYQATYNVDDHRRDIALIHNDGTTLAFRRINSVAPSGANEILTLDGSVSALANTTLEVCFLYMVRLDADDMELAWHTDDSVSVSLRFREIPLEIT